jgi:hypothetical protein
VTLEPFDRAKALDHVLHPSPVSGEQSPGGIDVDGVHDQAGVSHIGDGTGVGMLPSMGTQGEVDRGTRTQVPRVGVRVELEVDDSILVEMLVEVAFQLPLPHHHEDIEC